MPSALGNQNFRTYLIGSTVSLHGLWIFRVALAWYAWTLTGSEAWVGVIAFTQFAPALIFGPLFGVIADRFERRKLSVILNSGSSLNMLVLAICSFAGLIDIWILALFSVIQGILDGSHTPVRMALVPGIVEREELSSAIASTSIAFNVSRVIGPAISGLIIASLGVSWAFAVNSLSYLAIVIAVSVIAIRPRTRRSTVEAANAWRELKHGIRYVLNHSMIRTLLLLTALGTLFGRGALEMMPAVADAILARGSSGLAAMTSAVGAGAVLMGLVLARGAAWLDVPAIRLTLAAGSVIIVLFGASSSFLLSLVAVCLLGVTLSLAGVGSQILIQSHVDDDVRGRVSSLWGMIAFGGTAIGGLVIGLIADGLGLRVTLIGAGLICFVGTLFVRAPETPDSPLKDAT